MKDLIPPDARETLSRCAAGKSPWPVFLYGATGNGKSCAALSLLDHVRARTDYRTLSDIAEMLQQFFHASNDHGRPDEAVWLSGIGWTWRAATFWDWFRERDIIVVDEIGLREKSSDHTYETLKRVIDVREGLPAIYISNLAPSGLATLYDDRIASRLVSGTLIPFAGIDRRIPRDIPPAKLQTRELQPQRRAAGEAG